MNEPDDEGIGGKPRREEAEDEKELFHSDTMMRKRKAMASNSKLARKMGRSMIKLPYVRLLRQGQGKPPKRMQTDGLSRRWHRATARAFSLIAGRIEAPWRPGFDETCSSFLDLNCDAPF
jgi:hypothetical protein